MSNQIFFAKTGSGRCPRSNQAMITLSCVILPFLILGQGANPTLPKTKQEIQIVWDSSLEKIQKKFSTDKKTAAKAINILAYLTEFMEFQEEGFGKKIQIVMYYEIPNRVSFKDLLGISMESNEIEFRKRGAQIFEEMNKIFKSKEFKKLGIPDDYSALLEIRKNQNTLEIIKKNILDEKSGKEELLAIKMLNNALLNIKKQELKVAAEKQRLNEIQKKEDAIVAEAKQKKEAERLATAKKLQDAENAIAAEQKKVFDAKEMEIKKLEIADIPKKIKLTENQVTEKQNKLMENKKAIEEYRKKIAKNEAASALDMRRLPKVPTALQNQVKERLLEYTELNKFMIESINVAKKENVKITEDIEEAKKKIEALKIEYQKETDKLKVPQQ